MNKDKINTIKNSFKAAFPHTIPIFAGFWFIGLTYGIYMNVSGFSFIYPMIMSAVIFGGSLEFIAVSMLLSPFAPVQVFIMAVLVQARHIFYGISMFNKFKDTGWKKFFLIFGMCDETFSINYTADIPKNVDKGWFMIFVTVLNWLYWVSGATIGGIAGSYLKFNVKGLEFVMTAMFTAIFIDQWKKEKTHIPGIIGLVMTALCLAVFGKKAFIIPSMALIVISLLIFAKPIAKRGGYIR